MKKKNFYPSILAGLSLIIMAIAAFYSTDVLRKLTLPGNAVVTLEQLVVDKQLFMNGIIGWCIIIITDLVVTWGFFIILKKINPKVSLIAAATRMIYTVILIIAVSKLFSANNVIANITEIKTTEANQVMNSIDTFQNIWSLGLIIFGIHLFLVGYIALQSKSIPKIISILIIIAGVGYSIIHLMNTFSPQLNSFTHVIEMVLLLPMIIGELGFGIWLLIKGRLMEEIL